MQATSTALDRMLRAVGDPLAAVRGIGPGHPEFSAALALRAGAGVLAKSPDALTDIAAAIRLADGHAIDTAARAHLRAAEAWLCAKPALAAESYTEILHRWPHDLLALRLAQSCYFYLGRHDQLCAVVESVLPAWTPGQPAFQFVQAMAAFAYAESGDAARAEALGRQALATDPACPYGVHAVAHALAESARNPLGARWMREQRAQWDGESRMRTHNAWHLAMFDVDAGDTASALGILDTWLLPASAHSPIDACDATALLWRLTGNGIDGADRWRRISDAFERRLAPGFWPFVDLHAALAYWMAGHGARAQRLTQAIERSAQGDDYLALRARRITRPGLRALAAWSRGRHNDAAEQLADLRPFLGQAGGSRIQLELFRSIEREATHEPSVRAYLSAM